MAELKQAETHIEELETQMQRERIAQQEVLQLQQPNRP